MAKFKCIKEVKMDSPSGEIAFKEGKIYKGRYEENGWYFKSELDGSHHITPPFLKEYFEKVDDFELPEKWCIKSGEPEVVDYCNKNGVNKGTYTVRECGGSYAHFPSSGHKTTSTYKQPDYTEITFEQFKKYVLKQKETKMENKKLIGYKLAKQEYEEAACKIAQCQDFKEKYEGGSHLTANSLAEGRLKKAGVLDLWFEPVYKEVEPEVAIGGYTSEIKSHTVKFGCQEYTKQFVIELDEFLSKNTFDVREYKWEVNKLAKFFQKQ